MKTRFSLAVLILLTIPLVAQDYNAFRVYYRDQLARNKIVGSSVFILNGTPVVEEEKFMGKYAGRVVRR